MNNSLAQPSQHSNTDTQLQGKLPTVIMLSGEQYPHHNTNTQQVIKNADALAAAGLPLQLVIPGQLKGLTTPGYDVAKAISDYYHVPFKRLNIKCLWSFPASKLRIDKFFHLYAGLIYLTFQKYDLIYSRNEFTVLFNILLGRKTVFETYRRWGEEMPRTMRWLAKWAHKPAFLGIIFHSRLSLESVKKMGFPEEKLAVFHNGFDFADISPVLSKQEARQQLGWPQDERTLVYAGNMQASKGIESLVEIAALLPQVRLVLVGGMPEHVQRLKNYAAKLSADNISFTGHQPIKAVARYLYAADALIIPPVSAPLEKYGRTVLPFKTFLYLAAGRPIIAARQADLEEVLTHEHNALLVRPDDVQDCAAALRRLFSDEALLESISRNAAASAQQLTWEERAKNIISWLCKVWEKSLG